MIPTESPSFPPRFRDFQKSSAIPTEAVIQRRQPPGLADPINTQEANIVVALSIFAQKDHHPLHHPPHPPQPAYSRSDQN